MSSKIENMQVTCKWEKSNECGIIFNFISIKSYFVGIYFNINSIAKQLESFTYRIADQNTLVKA